MRGRFHRADLYHRLLVAEFAAEWWNRLWRGTGRRAEAVLPRIGCGDFQEELRLRVMAGAVR